MVGAILTIAFVTVSFDAVSGLKAERPVTPLFHAVGEPGISVTAES